MIRSRTAKLNNRLVVLNAALADETKKEQLQKDLKDALEQVNKQKKIREDAEKTLGQLRAERDDIAAEPQKLDLVAAAGTGSADQAAR